MVCSYLVFGKMVFGRKIQSVRLIMEYAKENMCDNEKYKKCK
jgi:hypothetical protein